jgi:hypothetical protein
MESPSSSALSSATTVPAGADPAKKVGKRASVQRRADAANDCGSGKKNTALLERVVACTHFTDSEKAKIVIALLRGY